MLVFAPTSGKVCRSDIYVNRAGCQPKLSRPLLRSNEARIGQKQLIDRLHCCAQNPISDASTPGQQLAQGVQSAQNTQGAQGIQNENNLVSEPEASPSGIKNYTEAELLPVRNSEGEVGSFPEQPGVYGMFDANKDLQYIGLSRKVAQTVALYSKELPDLTHFIKFTTSTAASREQMIEVWKAWMQDGFKELGKVPPGNERDNQTWTPKRKVKAEIKLTPGKGIQDLTIPMRDIVDQVVKSFKVVAFVKGTRTQPQCGFSYKVLSMLNELGADYEVLNVLDETYNPTLREVIKEYSEWPTIPQLYVKGEFVGGADILEEMHNKGELKTLLNS